MISCPSHLEVVVDDIRMEWDSITVTLKKEFNKFPEYIGWTPPLLRGKDSGLTFRSIHFRTFQYNQFLCQARQFHWSNEFGIDSLWKSLIPIDLTQSISWIEISNEQDS